MRRITGGVLVLGLGLSAIAAEAPIQNRPATPAEQYKALLDAQALASSSGRVLSDEERMTFIGQTYKRWNELAAQFVALAERNPKDPVALDALIRAVWYVNTTPWPVELVGTDDVRAKAFTLLLRDHVRSEKLAPLCERVAGGFAEEYETFLRALLKQNPHREVQAQACLALAHYLANRSQRLDLITAQPRAAREFADLYGKEYLDRLQHQDRGKATSEAEALFERALRDYGDVKLSGAGTIGEKAKLGLFELRNLVVSKVAPEIEADDQDGRRFRLSDYRGKVVLIDFWSEY
jgi:hypothetical protein